MGDVIFGTQEIQKQKEKAIKLCRKLLPRKWAGLGDYDKITMYEWVSEHYDDIFNILKETQNAENNYSRTDLENPLSRVKQQITD
jgi:hypothetical protein